MMKYTTKFSQRWGTLAALLFVLSLFGIAAAGCNSVEPPLVKAPVEAYPQPLSSNPTVTAPAYPPPGEPEEPTAAPVYVQPPLCEFGPGPTPEASGVSLEDYVFSEPQIVFTSPRNVNLVEWLPDSQWILMTHDILDDGRQQVIELFNPTTGEVQVFAERSSRSYAPPAWNTSLDAVVYSKNIILDGTTHSEKDKNELWISYGDSDDAQLISDNIATLYPVISPDDGRIAYAFNEQLSLRDSSLEVSQTIDFDPSQWQYHEENRMYSPYETAWRPDSSQIAFYNAGYFFLVDVNTGQICEVDLGSEDAWATVARWSPDGRYLALGRTSDLLPIKSSELAVLDTVIGQWYTMRPTPDMDGQHYVTDVAWAPDSYHIAVVGVVNKWDGTRHKGLYFVDFILERSVQLNPRFDFGIGKWGTNLIWSPDGLQLLFACPTGEKERLCLISVKVSNMP